jgi:hypothetical protein
MEADMYPTNANALQPVLIVPKGTAYRKAHKDGLDKCYKEHQAWLQKEVGQTVAVLPTVHYYSNKTLADFLATNPYYLAQEDIEGRCLQDSTGQLIRFCNPQRLYTLNSVGVTGIGNMAGRSSWRCQGDPDNPLEPWGPGVAAGATGLSLDRLAGLAPPGGQLGIHKGAMLHELLHCLGVQHPTEAEHGPQAWLSPMAGFWFYGTPECHLLPHEIALLRQSPFFS